ncbi:MAG TPA: TIGR03086 family metal-binding protein [Acidimicrobiales bacterium]|nr:TIGR03086 family metal-binding protein [Acidimicrobiales bacterium]
MADLVELFNRAVGRFGARVAAIGDQWSAPTPDAEWDVRTLVNHVLSENLWAPPLLSGSTIASVGDRFDGDQLGDKPDAAWTAAAASSIAAVADEGALNRTVHVSFGDISGQEYVSQLVCDHVIHGWDLDRAIGTEELIDSELVDFAYGFLLPQAEAWRAAGAFGPKVDVPESAGRQAELLALTGRNPARGG